MHLGTVGLKFYTIWILKWERDSHQNTTTNCPVTSLALIIYNSFNPEDNITVKNV